MSDFKKEKQAMEKWEKEEDDPLEEKFAQQEAHYRNDIALICTGFYGGYHSRDEELTRLRAEIDRLRRDEKDRAEGNQEYAHFRRRQRLKKCQSKHKRALKKNEKLRAEIERKDDALRRIVDAFSPEIIHIGTMKTKYKAIYDVDSFDPIKQAKQALRNKEDSNELP